MIAPAAAPMRAPVVASRLALLVPGAYGFAQLENENAVAAAVSDSSVFFIIDLV